MAHLLDLVDGVDDGGMMLAAEGPSNFRKRRAGEFLNQVHGHLAWVNHLLRVAFFFELRLFDLKPFGDGFLDGIDGNPAVLHVHQVLEHLLGHR